MAEQQYDSVNIQVLKGLQAVRLRPGMYVGDSGKKGLHHLVWEIIDNSVDEAMAGHCTEIKINISKDGETLSVEDNGRGIPVSIHPTEGKSSLEIVMTVLHAGGKFDGSGYSASGGLHGVGASVVNALSDYLLAEVWRDAGYYTQEYSEGIPKYDVKRVRDLNRGEKTHGTRITFHADKTIFKDGIKFDEAILLKRLREVIFLNKGLKVSFNNEQTGTKETLIAEGGIGDYVKYLTEARSGLYPVTPIYVERTIPFRDKDSLRIELALNYAEEDDETILGFANNINTTDGGTHTSGFKTALTRVVNQFGRSTGLLKDKDSNLSGDDVREGLTAIVSVRFPQPEFVGQTKAKLGTVEIEGLVSTVTTEILTEYFEKNAAVIKKIVERALIAQEARDAAKKASTLIRRRSLLGNNGRLPGKLSDCNSNKRDISELFLVEGNSAAGSAKDGRDPETQAILPLRGKIINAEKNNVVALLKNNEIQSIIMALGTNFKDDFDISGLRYGKVILMCDADDDGHHIATLLLTFFFRYMKPLVTGGFLYLAMPPLFRVDNGKERTYCFNEKEMQEASKKAGEKAKIVRFKGLGEMDAEELGDTTMDKSKRRLIQLSVTDLGESERILSILMGSNVQARKTHISGQVNSVIHA